MKASKNRYLSDDHEDFTVEDPEAIVGILRKMARKNAQLTGSFNGGVDVLLTAVLEVDPGEGVVYLDVNANEERNQELLSSKRVIFYAMFEGAKVQWACTAIAGGEFDGRRAFRVDIPEKLQHVQRRGAYRVNTPIVNPVLCRVPVAPDREVTLPLVDLCVEGIGVILPPAPEAAIQRGAEFEDCVIEHPDLGEVEVSLHVKSVWEVTLKNGLKSQRAGLEFIDIDGITQSAIQRFVFKLERLMVEMSRQK